jgi:rubrerythrin
MAEFYIPYGYHQSLLQEVCIGSVWNPKILKLKRELKDSREEISGLKSRRQKLRKRARKSNEEKIKSVTKEIKKQEAKIRDKLEQLRIHVQNMDLETATATKRELQFPGGKFKYRRVHSYPKGYMIYEKATNTRDDAQSLEDLVWQENIPDEGFVSITQGTSLNPVSFGDNGDLLNSYDPVGSNSDRDFVFREIMADDGFKRCLLIPRTIRHFLKKLDPTFKTGNANKTAEQAIEIAVFQFVSKTEAKREPIGYAKRENRDSWLDKSLKGNKNWKGFAFRYCRGLIQTALMAELGITKDRNYPNKEYRALRDAFEDMGKQILPGMSQVYQVALKNPACAELHREYQKKKASKLDESKLLEKGLFIECRNQIQKEIQKEINRALPDLKGWANERELAAAVVVLGFDVFIFIKESKDALPQELSGLSSVRTKKTLRFADLMQGQSAKTLLKWVPSREEVEGQAGVEYLANRTKKKEVKTDLKLIEELANAEKKHSQQLSDLDPENKNEFPQISRQIIEKDFVKDPIGKQLMLGVFGFTQETTDRVETNKKDLKKLVEKLSRYIEDHLPPSENSDFKIARS